MSVPPAAAVVPLVTMTHKYLARAIHPPWFYEYFERCCLGGLQACKGAVALALCQQQEIQCSLQGQQVIPAQQEMVYNYIVTRGLLPSEIARSRTNAGVPDESP
jgi:hypothetical protein